MGERSTEHEYPWALGHFHTTARNENREKLGRWKFSVGSLQWISLEKHSCLLLVSEVLLDIVLPVTTQAQVSVSGQIIPRTLPSFLPGAEAEGKETFGGPRRPVLRFRPARWCMCYRPARPPASAAQRPKETRSDSGPQGTIDTFRDFRSLGYLSRVWDKCSVWPRLVLCSRLDAFHSLRAVIIRLNQDFPEHNHSVSLL